MTREAKDGVINECRGTLYEWLKVGRFNDEKTFEEEDEDDWGSKDGCRIMGIMYENGKFLTIQCLQSASIQSASIQSASRVDTIPFNNFFSNFSIKPWVKLNGNKHFLTLKGLWQINARL